jgi:hypothetical protein
MLRKTFGPKRDEVTGEWRKLHYEELNDLYSSSSNVWVNKLRRLRWAEHAARMGVRRGVCRVLVGKPEGKKPPGRPRRGWVDNIKKDLQKEGCSVSTSISQDSWFQQSHLKIMEVLFLTYIVRRLPGCTIQLEHTSAQERLLIEANFADR